MSAPGKRTAPLSIQAARLWQDFEELGRIGRTPAGGQSRPAFSPEDTEARVWFAERIDAAGFVVCDDDAGNISARLPADDPAARTLLLGSHLDTTPNGGRFDGVVGVLAALEVLRTVHEAGLRLPVHLEAINFTDEEGTWHSLLGSRLMVGQMTAAMLDADSQRTAEFRVAAARVGLPVPAMPKARRDPASLVGYLELHVETGDHLDRLDVPLGVVTHIVGRSTFVMTLYGERGHSGATPPGRRRDALLGAAHLITRVHGQLLGQFPGGTVSVGRVDVEPGVFNVVPERAELLVEVRHVREAVLGQMEQALLLLAQAVADEFRLRLSVRRTVHMPAAPMDPDVVRAVEQACAGLGMPCPQVVSYAGHDAQALSSITPSAMIFVRTIGGISHGPQEFSRWDDVVLGANALLHTTLALAARAAPPKRKSRKPPNALTTPSTEVE